MTPITDAALDELKKLETAATPEPWIAKGEGDMICVTDAESKYVIDRFTLPSTRPIEQRWNDAGFIAYVRNAFAGMVARMEAAEGLLAECLDVIGDSLSFDLMKRIKALIGGTA